MFRFWKNISQRITWVQLTAAMQDILFVALYEFNVEGSKRGEKSVLQSSGFAKLYRSFDTKVFIVEGIAYFSCLGPRLVDSWEIMAHPMHTSLFQLPHNLPAAVQIK